MNQQEVIWHNHPELMQIPIPKMDELPLSLRLHTNPMLLAQSLRNQYLLNSDEFFNCSLLAVFRHSKPLILILVRTHALHALI